VTAFRRLILPNQGKGQREVRSLVISNNDFLTSFALPSLDTVGNVNFAVMHNDALTYFDVSALTNVKGSFPIHSNLVLNGFDLSSLWHVLSKMRFAEF